MKNNSSVDFSKPMMQSYAAILIIMLRFYKLLLRQFFPLIILLFIEGQWVRSNWLLFIVIPLALLGTVYSIVAFFRHRFHINEGKLIVTKGVFRRTRIEIPLDRIQSVNFHQNIIHQLLDVVQLDLDTAGSKGNEMELYALKRGTAQSLSKVVLAQRKEGKPEDEEISEAEDGEMRHLIFDLNFGQVLKVGVTENHIRSGGIILVFVFWLYDNLREIGLDIEQELENYIPLAEQISRNLIMAALLILIIAGISFIISIVRTVLRYYGLAMFRSGDGFTIRSGLIDKKENSAKDHKIQLLIWTQNVLQRLAGIYVLAMKQASSIKTSDKKAIRVAGLDKNDIEKIQNYLYKEKASQVETMQMHNVDIYYLVRRVYIWTYIFIAALAAIWITGEFQYISLALAIYIFALYTSWLSYKKKKYGYTEDLMAIDGGSLGNSKIVLPVYKAQAVSIHSNPFQRRRGLASVVIHTASGSAIIPQVPEETARIMRDIILYFTESSRRKWM